MPNSDKVEIADWTPEWANTFGVSAAGLRQALGGHALRIDHIGSTAIAGLAAKPIIDIQISVADLRQTDILTDAMTVAGYVYRRSNPDLTKLYFRERPGDVRTHIHVRQHGSWHEQWPLLFRDYMRNCVEEHGPYVSLKRELARRHGNDRDAYTEGKMDHLWNIIRRADRWAQNTGWRLEASDV